MTSSTSAVFNIFSTFFLSRVSFFCFLLAIRLASSSLMADCCRHFVVRVCLPCLMANLTTASCRSATILSTAPFLIDLILDDMKHIVAFGDFILGAENMPIISSASMLWDRVSFASFAVRSMLKYLLYWGQDYKRFSSMSRCSTHNLCSEMT